MQIDFNTQSLEAFEEYLSTAYGPAKVSPIGRSQSFGRTGRIFTNAHIMIEWARMNGSYRIEPKVDIDGFIFNMSNVHGSEYRFAKGTFELAPAQALVYRDIKAVSLFDGSNHTSAVFPRTSLQRRLAILLDDEVSRPIDFNQDPVPITLIRKFCSLLSDVNRDSIIETVQHNKRSDAFSSLIIDTLILEYPNNFWRQLKGDVSLIAPRQVKRAIDFMHANTANNLTIDLIAHEAGVSVRALQAAFERFKGMSPFAYLKILRLKGVRAALQDTGQSLTVAEIAERWGFTNSGRLSKAYYLAFGELPSETSKKRLTGSNRPL